MPITLSFASPIYVAHVYKTRAAYASTVNFTCIECTVNRARLDNKRIKLCSHLTSAFAFASNFKNGFYGNKFDGIDHRKT